MLSNKSLIIVILTILMENVKKVRIIIGKEIAKEE